MVRGRKKKLASSAVIIQGKKFPPVMYGLQGIMELFGVSKATASRYKNTILRNAIGQQGNVIIVDTLECLKIFGVLHPENLIEVV